MKTAVFAYRKESPQSGLLTGKPELFKMLEERGVDAAVSLSAETAFDSDGIETHRLLDDSTTRRGGHVALDSVGIVVNRLDRSVKINILPKSWQDNMPPLENENAMRSLVYRKHRVQEEVFAPLDLGMPTLLVENIFQIDSFVSENPSEYYILKPTSGTFSRNVHKLKAKDVADHLIATDGFGKMILQPAYDFSISLPSDVQPYDEASREGFRAWNVADVTKELRMYAFHSPESTSVFPVARAMKDGQDNWFFVDPESIPGKLIADTTSVITRAAKITGSRAIYAALDIGYGRLGANAPDYHAIELNGLMPYMVGYDKHPGVAGKLRGHFADQIHQTIYGNGGKIE